jgi:hypothetical protein
MSEPAGRPGVPGEAQVQVQQLDEVRARLQRDGVAVGLSADEVGQAVDAAAAQYATAPVQTFVGVLVERMVRQELSIPRNPA